MRRSVLLGVVLAGGPGVAWAQSCTVSATAVAFGNYAPFSALASDSAGTVSVRCSAVISIGTSYAISLGAGAGGSFGGRRMAGGSLLTYQLYTDLLRTQVWGDGTGGTGTVTDLYLLQALVPITRSYPVYGRIPARQNAVPGSYTDTILVTLSY